MKRVTLSELRSSVRKCLARMRKGEELLVTHRGIPVARLVPVPPVDAEYAAMADLIHSGQIRPPLKKLSNRFLNRLPRIRDPEGLLRKGLDQERESGW